MYTYIQLDYIVRTYTPSTLTLPPVLRYAHPELRYATPPLSLPPPPHPLFMASPHLFTTLDHEKSGIGVGRGILALCEAFRSFYGHLPAKRGQGGLWRAKGSLIGVSAFE